MDYIAEPLSRQNLRELAKIIRTKLKINTLFFPVVELLDVLSRMFEKFNYEIVEDSNMPKDVHADTNSVTGHIRIRQSVYDNACAGNGRDRMTIAHEIAHFFLICLCGYKFQRNFTGKTVEAYRNPEWQAKCLAAELMIPNDAVIKLNLNPSQIERICGVSKAAAEYQYTKL